MVMLSSDVVMRRLQDIHGPTQEAIETMSLWIMHYKDKASIDVIVEGWLNSFRIAVNDQKRIALFYVMNDVVQKAKNKHIDTLIPAFQPAVLTVVGIGRKSEKVKTCMKRCIEIFRQRQVFTSASITAMENLLEADDIYDAEETVLDIDNDEIVRKITAFIAARNVVADIMKNINNGDFDYRERVQTGMKDREEGAYVLQEVHEAIDTVVKARHSMETQKKKMIDLIETLELAKRVYMHQKREVLVVEEAYINFRDGIKAVQKELVEMEQTGIYPGLTPPREAPSPTADDDIYATGVERAIQHFQEPETWDNRQPMDMEMDEEDRPQDPIPLLQPPPIAPQPSLQSRILQLGLKQIAEGEPGAMSVEQKNEQRKGNILDFSKPPPNFAATSQNLEAFGNVGNSSDNTRKVVQTHEIQEILKLLPKTAGKGLNIQVQPSFQMPLQQRGMAMPTSATTANIVDTDDRSMANIQQGYSGSLISPGVQSASSAPIAGGYQAHFEPRDPRLMGDPRLTIPPQTALGGYQGNFEEPKLITPPPVLSSTGGRYQSRFDQGGSVAIPPPMLLSTSGGGGNGVGSGYQGRFEGARNEHQHQQRDQFERRSSPTSTPRRGDHQRGDNWNERDGDRDRGYRGNGERSGRNYGGAQNNYERGRGGRGNWRGSERGFRGGWRGGNNRY